MKKIQLVLRTLFWGFFIFLFVDVSSANCSLIGASVEGELIWSAMNYKPGYGFASDTTIISDPEIEFYGNVYTYSTRTVVDAFADFSGQTLTIGFIHVAGDLGISSGHPYRFQFSNILFTNPAEKIVDLTFVSSQGANWMTDPTTWIIETSENSILLITDDDLDVIDGSGYNFGVGGSVSATFQVNTAVPVPSAIWLLGSGLIGIVGFRRKFGKEGKS